MSPGCNLEVQVVGFRAAFIVLVRLFPTCSADGSDRAPDNSAQPSRSGSAPDRMVCGSSQFWFAPLRYEEPQIA
jgi:hypothetical protein